jgi:hypothetical protein
LLTITAVPVAAETTAITTRPGGFYYDEFIYEDMEERPEFLFGAGDYLYAVTYNRPSSDQVYRYTIHAFDKEAKFKWKYDLPYGKNQRYHEFSSEIDGDIILTVFIPYEDGLPGENQKRFVGDRVTYRLADGQLTAKKTEENFVLHERYNVNKEYEVVKQTDTFYKAGETDIKSVSVSGGNLFCAFRDGSTGIIANKQVIKEDLARERTAADDFIDLQRGDFGIIDGYDIKIFRKTDRKHPDLQEFYVGYTSESQYIYRNYVDAYNENHDDFTAVPRLLIRPLKTESATVDVILLSQFDPVFSEYKKEGLLADLYEFMGKGYFDKEKILMNLLSANETDGKLHSFSPLWEFEIMTANADTVTADDFTSFEAMTNLEKELDNNRHIFSDKTRNAVFGNLSDYYITDCYDIDTGKADIKASELEDLAAFAKLYPTFDEYSASEDFDKMKYANYGGYYEGGDSPPYNITQFDIGDYRSGRYAASVFTGISLPVDMDYEDVNSYNIFRNFSSYVNILYDSNFVLPGFWGKGYVKGTPSNFDTAAVLSSAKNTGGAKSFINFLLTEFEPDYYHTLSADVLEREAENALKISRTHERGGETVRDTIYFSVNDYFEINDATAAEVMPLLNAIKYGSFPAKRIPNNYYDYYYSVITGDFETINEFLDGKISATEIEKLSEEALTERLKNLAEMDTYY